MIWIVRALVIVHVARGAIRGQARADALRVARRAIDVVMPAAQRERCRVFERNSVPRGRRVTFGAVGAEIVLLVVWIVRAHKVFKVARGTLVGNRLDVRVGVAGRASNGLMRIAQGE